MPCMGKGSLRETQPRQNKTKQQIGHRVLRATLLAADERGLRYSSLLSVAAAAHTLQHADYVKVEGRTVLGLALRGLDSHSNKFFISHSCQTYSNHTTRALRAWPLIFNHKIEPTSMRRHACASPGMSVLGTHFGSHDPFELLGLALREALVVVVSLECVKERGDLGMSFGAFAHGAQRHALDVLHVDPPAELHGRAQFALGVPCVWMAREQFGTLSLV
jgi:hypothetical protein